MRVSLQIAITAAATFGVALLFLWTTQLYAQRYPQIEVSAFFVYRTYALFVSAAVSLGMQVALRRFVGFHAAEPPLRNAAALVGLLTGSLALGAGTAAAAIFLPRVAPTLGIDQVETWRALMVLTFAQGVCTFVSFAWLAQGNAGRSGVMTLWGAGLAPLLALYVMPGSLPHVLLGSALLVGVATLPPALWMVTRGIAAGLRRAAGLVRGMFRFGITRMAANSLELALEPATLWLAARNQASTVEVGYLAIGFLIIRLLNPVATAFNNVLVPASARLSAVEDVGRLRGYTRLLSQGALHVGLFASLQLVVWTDVLIGIWLGPEYLAGTPVARVVVLALAPSLAFLALRGMVDGQSETAVNGWNLLAAATLLVLAGWLLTPVVGAIHAAAAAYLLSKVLLAITTLHHQQKLYNLTTRDLQLIPALLLNAAAFAGSLGLRQLAGPNPLAMTAAVALATAVFVGGMTAIRTTWTEHILNSVQAMYGNGLARLHGSRHQ